MARWSEIPEHLKDRASDVTIAKFAENTDTITIRGRFEPEPTQRGLIISINKLLPGLNGKDGLIRQNHFKATKLKTELLELVKSGNYGTFGQARVKIICTRYYCGTAMDFDNASASFKYLIDAIVKAGIIYDDSPKTIEEWTVKQVAVSSRKLQKMEVEILFYETPT